MGSRNNKSPKANSRGKNANTYNKLFHGSPSTDIINFDDNHMGLNTSSGEKFIYFTDDINFADEFSYQRIATNSMFINKKGNKGNVYQADVIMKNPLDFNNLSGKDIKNIIKMDDEKLLTASKVKMIAKVGNHQLLKAQFNINNLSKYGYDGYIAKVRKDSNALEYAVISSKQISNTKKYK